MADRPVATEEQHAHEREALALVEHPVVREAFDRVKRHWLEVAGPKPGPDMLARFDACFEAVLFPAAMGSRWGLDDPDSVFSRRCPAGAA